MKKLFSFLFVLLLIGCGGGNSNDSNNSKITKEINTSNSSDVKVNNDNTVDTNIEDISIISDTTEGIIGVAKLGLLKNAILNIYKINIYRTAQRQTMGLTLLYQGKTTDGDINTAGRFNTHSSALDDNAYYIYEIEGGENIDYNEDGIEDNISVTNYGAVRTIVKGSTLKSLNDGEFKISLISERYFMQIYPNLTSGFFMFSPDNELKDNVNIDADINNDGEIDEKDVLIFDPVNDKSKITTYYSYSDNYKNLHKRASYQGQPIYIGWDFIGEPIDFELSQDEKTAYVVSAEGLRILDITKPNDIKSKALYRTARHIIGEPTTNMATSVLLSSDETRAYITISGGGLLVLDIKDPTNPIKLGSFATDNAKDVVLSLDENTAYIADGLGSFKVLDISNIADIKEKSSLITDYHANKLSLSKDGKYVFVSKYPDMFASSYGIAVIDVSGTDAIEIENKDIGGIGNSIISPDGTLLYVANRGSGLRIYNISNPNNMEEVVHLPIDYSDISYINFLNDKTKIFLVDSYRDIWIVDISNSNSPKLLSYIADGANKISFSSDNTKIFLITKEDFYIMDTKNFIMDTNVTFSDIPI